MSIQRGFFAIFLLGVIIWIAWYAFTYTHALDPEMSPTIGALQQAEELAHTQCVTAAQREYQINSDNGTTDPGKAFLKQMNASVEACNTKYRRK